MFDELRYFLLIAEHETFTEAARRAHLSQPALTAAIHRLEARMGAPLFVRGRRGASLTAAGHALVPRARAALSAIDDGARAVAEVAGLRAGEVRVGGGATACTYLLPPTLAAFRRRHPNIRIVLREATTDEALDAIAGGDLDLAVVTVPGEGDEALRTEPGRTESGRTEPGRTEPGRTEPGRTDPWRDDPLVLVGAPGVDASRAPYVTFRRGTSTRRLFDAAFPDADVVMELSSIAAVKGNVREGIGLALVSAAAVESDLALGRLVRVDDPRTPIHRTLSIVHPGLERLPPAATALRALLLGAAARARSGTSS
jgi:DNA-binding transcriptional LysR family regulator